MKLNLYNYINDDINLIEIYISTNIKDSKCLNISIDKELANKLHNRFKCTRDISYHTFNKNNLSYIYDKSNDSQIVTTKIAHDMKLFFNKKAKIFNSLYLISYKEDKLPTHYFPCTNDLDNETIYNIKEYRINNRISLFLKEENQVFSFYINYKHNNNVDIDKIQETLNNLIKTIEKLI